MKDKGTAFDCNTVGFTSNPNAVKGSLILNQCLVVNATMAIKCRTDIYHFLKG